MALSITLTVTPPSGMTDQELTRLVADGLGWNQELGIARGPFIKQQLIQFAINAARDRKRQEVHAEAAAAAQSEIDGIAGS